MENLGIEIQGIKLYNLKDTAQILGVTPQTVRSYIKQGRLTGRRIGRPIYVTDEELKKFISKPQK